MVRWYIGTLCRYRHLTIVRFAVTGEPVTKQLTLQDGRL